MTSEAPLIIRPRPSGHSATMAHVNPDRDAVNFFPTWPWGARAGGRLIRSIDPRARTCWEPACGAGSMVHGLKDYFPTVHASDAYLYDGNLLFDFLSNEDVPFEADWICTNPPFDHCEAFIRLAYKRARRGVAMLMRVGMLEGATRYPTMWIQPRMFGFAPFIERLPIVQYVLDPSKGSAAFYCWFIWLKPGVGPRRRAPYPYAIDAMPPGTRDALTKPGDMAFAARLAA